MRCSRLLLAAAFLVSALCAAAPFAAADADVLHAGFRPGGLAHAIGSLADGLLELLVKARTMR